MKTKKSTLVDRMNSGGYGTYTPPKEEKAVKDTKKKAAPKPKK